jgi:hypothetical protein
MTDDEARDRLRRLLEGQSLGVLATSSGHRTHATLVAFAFTDDLRQVIFATSRNTRKFADLKAHPAAALLVDNRKNDVEDFHDASVATAHGPAAEVAPDQQETLRQLYLLKHPYLAEFVRAPSCALLSIAVRSYDLVHNFQEVHVLRFQE